MMTRRRRKKKKEEKTNNQKVTVRKLKESKLPFFLLAGKRGVLRRMQESPGLGRKRMRRRKYASTTGRDGASLVFLERRESMESGKNVPSSTQECVKNS